MNDQSWINEIPWQDVVAPVGCEAEEIYTLKMTDFLVMPDVDFKELVALDPDLRALLN